METVSPVVANGLQRTDPDDDRYPGPVTTPAYDTYWATRDYEYKATHDGGKMLEISPWMWRVQPWFNYHLSGDPSHVRKIYENGYEGSHTPEICLSASLWTLVYLLYIS